MHFISGREKNWNAFYLACDKDKPIKPMIEVITDFYVSCYNIYDIVIMTGRGEIAKHKTIKWLRDNKIYYDTLFMRPEKNYNPAVYLKRNWLIENFKKSKILCAFDDDPNIIKMWNDEGILALQVNQGE